MVLYSRNMVQKQVEYYENTTITMEHVNEYYFPTAEKGEYFIGTPYIEFSVNKDCDNLDMANADPDHILRCLYAFPAGMAVQLFTEDQL